ncbi:MAG: metalloregulator ArsR/SmtB family transcription factor [Candidatus Cloacimonadota bacterium]|nr:metalloregulator ArsR/SmtB family transcription factor [Candidatus Cloacimonadota bacterium]
MNQTEQISENLKILAEPTRLRILKLLLENDYLCVNAITCRLDVSQSTVSQHLRILRQANLVSREKRAKNIHYSLNKTRVNKIMKLFTEFWQS